MNQTPVWVYHTSPSDSRCATEGCVARFSNSLHNLPPDEGGRYNGWYYPEPEREDVPVHDHRPVSPYQVQPSLRHADLRQLAGRPTPRIQALSGSEFGQLTSRHGTDCDSCGGEEAWVDCSAFCPARLQGICSTLWVITQWIKDGGIYRLDVHVLYLAEGGPHLIYDRIGPFEDIPAAYMWAASVAGAEIARESGA